MALFTVIYKLVKIRVFSSHLVGGWKYASFGGGDTNKKGGFGLLFY